MRSSRQEGVGGLAVVIAPKTDLFGTRAEFGSAAQPDPVTIGPIHHCVSFSLWSDWKRAKVEPGSGGFSYCVERCDAFSAESRRRTASQFVGHKRLGPRRHGCSKELRLTHSWKPPGRFDNRTGRESCS